MKISKSFRRLVSPCLLLAAPFAVACSSSNSVKPGGTKTDGGVQPSGDSGVGNAAGDWTMMGYDSAGTYWNRAETKITTATAPNLVKAWDFDTAGQVSSSPVISGGHAYVFASTGVFGLDLATGNQQWTNADVTGFSSLAYDNHVIYAHDSAGKVHALADSDGHELWSYQTDSQAGLVGFSSPIVTKDYVIIGGSTLEEISPPTGGATFRGFVEAIKKDGTLGWKKYTVEEPAHGATLWSSVSVDEAGGVVFAGTGNNHGAPATDTSDAFLALPLKDGADFLWKQQILTGDIWMLAGAALASPDSDFGENPIVFDVNGQKLVAGGNKGGDFWVLDRTTGTVIKKRTLGPGNAAKGGVFINGAWDGKRILVANNGQTSTGSGSEQADKDHVATLFALDPLTLDIQWERQVAGPVYGTITVANGVGFFGKSTTLQAFNTETGAVLMEFPTEGTIDTSPAISNGYVVFGSGMSWTANLSIPGTKFYALKVP